MVIKHVQDYAQSLRPLGLLDNLYPSFLYHDNMRFLMRCRTGLLIAPFLVDFETLNELCEKTNHSRRYSIESFTIFIR